jgi:hypothetical protein
VRILIEGQSDKHYLAKCHEAFRTGLRALFDTRCFGRGYPRYRPYFRTYDQIVKHMFGADLLPDLLLANFYFPYEREAFKYRGFARVPCRKGFVLSDYWGVTGSERQGFVDCVLRSNVDFIVSLFPQPLEIFRDSPIGGRLIYLPPCFDPAIFNDWQRPKVYDVGFLAAGTVDPSEMYPERARIHQRLLKKGLKYLWAAHPGWDKNVSRHPLVGIGFSQAINSCRLFVTTGGNLRNPHAKYIEILASNSLLLADEPVGADRLGLQDGFNYVKISEDDVEDKIDYYLAHREEAQTIATRGFHQALKRHNCYTRAVEFHEALAPLLGR